MRYEEYKTEYSLSLDPQQDVACSQTDGPLLLLAVPGSGKTTVMICRIGYLIRGLGVSADSVLALTYSVSGAKEMQERYREMFGYPEVEIRTINGFCAKIIMAYEKAYKRTAFKLIENDSEVSAIIKSIMSKLGGYPSENEVRDVKTAITYCRNMMLDEEEMAKQICIEGRDFPEIFKQYKQFKIENRLMDYDDQLAYGYSIMCRYPKISRAYFGRFKYICIDEAQDTSKLQHAIIRKAAEGCGNVFMVGDEDQSIYGFRAAYPEALLEFDTIYPDAKVMYLEKNYRCSGKIASAADRFIAENTLRRDKHMVSNNPDGEEIKHTELEDIKALPEYIKQIALEVKAGKRGSTAVLCRMNESFIPIIDLLDDGGIPYRTRGNDGLFFTHYIVNDIRDILAFAADPFDKELFMRLYYKFSCGISRSDADYAVRHNFGKGMLSYPEFIAGSEAFSERVRKKAKRLGEALYRINSTDAYGAIKLIMSVSGYGTYLSHRTNDPSRVNTLLALAERHRGKKELFERLDYLSRKVKEERRECEGIFLSTIHSAKGMEFDSVIVADARNGILPSVSDPYSEQLSADEKKTLEEDRRLFYVAITRAKRTLELITCRLEFGEKGGGADFVYSLLGKKPEAPARREGSAKDEKKIVAKRSVSAICVGDGVMHKVFGEGVILEKKDGFASVRFFRYPYPKKIDLEFCFESGIIKSI